MSDRRKRRERATTGAWQEAPGPVPLEDAATAAALAREVATPFGFKRPAAELLARFGGDTPDGRRRATAALAVTGIAANPPLDSVKPHQWVQLRAAAATPAAGSAAPAPSAPASAAPASAAPAPAAPAMSPAPAEPLPPAAADAPLPPRPSRRSLRPADIAARHAPTGPVTRERRFAAGALGLGALLVLLLAVVVLRGAIGGGNDTKGVLPTATAAAPVEPETTSAPPAPTTTVGRPAAVARSRAIARRPRAATSPTRRSAATAPTPPRTVRLRIVPTEPSYVCVADGRSGEKLWEGMRTGPYTVRRASLVLRIGVATAAVDVNGRPLQVNVAPSTYLLMPTGVRLAAGRSACGG